MLTLRHQWENLRIELWSISLGRPPWEPWDGRDRLFFATVRNSNYAYSTPLPLIPRIPLPVTTSSNLSPIKSTTSYQTFHIEQSRTQQLRNLQPLVLIIVRLCYQSLGNGFNLVVSSNLELIPPPLDGAPKTKLFYER